MRIFCIETLIWLKTIGCLCGNGYRVKNGLLPGHIGSNQMHQNVEPKTSMKRGSHIILQKYENVEYPGERVVDIWYN